MLSKRARAALDVLRQEAEGNSAAASALASLERDLGGEAKQAPPSPGKAAAARAMAEHEDSKEPGDSPAEDKAEPPNFGRNAAKAPAKGQSTSSATALPSFLKRRGRTARKGK